MENFETFCKYHYLSQNLNTSMEPVPSSMRVLRKALLEENAEEVIKLQIVQRRRKSVMERPPLVLRKLYEKEFIAEFERIKDEEENGKAPTPSVPSIFTDSVDISREEENKDLPKSGSNLLLLEPKVNIGHMAIGMHLGAVKNAPKFGTTHKRSSFLVASGSNENMFLNSFKKFKVEEPHSRDASPYARQSKRNYDHFGEIKVGGLTG